MTIQQMINANRAGRCTVKVPAIGEIRNEHVVVSVGSGHVMAVPKDMARKFTLQEWNEMAGKEELK